MADFADRSLGIGYHGGSALLLGLLLTNFAMWYWTLGSISVQSVATPKSEAFYWAGITLSQALGTSRGDWMAHSMGIGYDDRALIFTAGLAVPCGCVLLDERVARASVLGGIHPEPTSRRDTRRFSRQAYSRGRVGLEPSDRLRGNCGFHYRMHSFAATAARRIRC